jgi:hypothetical protein
LRDRRVQLKLGYDTRDEPETSIEGWSTAGGALYVVVFELSDGKPACFCKRNGHWLLNNFVQEAALPWTIRPHTGLPGALPSIS